MNQAEHTSIDPQDPQQGASHGGHGWMMIACCVPMLVIAGALVATGVVSGIFLVYAIVCTALMAMMMKGMGHAGDSGTK